METFMWVLAAGFGIWSLIMGVGCVLIELEIRKEDQKLNALITKFEEDMRKWDTK